MHLVFCITFHNIGRKNDKSWILPFFVFNSMKRQNISCRAPPLCSFQIIKSLKGAKNAQSIRKNWKTNHDRRGNRSSYECAGGRPT